MALGIALNGWGSSRRETTDGGFATSGRHANNATGLARHTRKPLR